MKSNNQIALTGIFLALSTLFALIQIPIVSFLSLDFSILIILISTNFLKYRNVIIISIFSPLFMMLIRGNDIIGMVFLIVANLFISFIFRLVFSKDEEIKVFKYSVYSIGLVIFISVVLTILNIILFTPAYYGFDYVAIYENINWFFYVLLPFNIFKFSLIFFFYGFYYFIFLKKSFLNKR